MKTKNITRAVPSIYDDSAIGRRAQNIKQAQTGHGCAGFMLSHGWLNLKLIMNAAKHNHELCTLTGYGRQN